MDGASSRNTSFFIGDAAQQVARPDDQLYVSRTGAGGIGMSVLRQQELVLAIGAIARLPLGKGIEVRGGPAGSHDPERVSKETWLEFRAGEEQLILHDREVGTFANYDIYVERCWECGTPGVDECVAMSLSGDDRVRRAAMRGAILLAAGPLKITSWDCTEEFV
ncbi:MAG TPA: hypothetical protein VN696_09485 [Pyrinomonadaceae bacterium]|nr:hypothetical protein [Pyrinomonadaceae bacterium]